MCDFCRYPVFTPLIRAAALGLGLVLSLARRAQAEVSVIDLKNGVQLRAEILAARPDRYVVDLGFTVLLIPREEVDRVSLVLPTGVEGSVELAPSALGALFRSVVNPLLLPVQANVERVGVAVVLIQTATGLGSGFIVNAEGYVVTNHHVIAGETELTVTRFVREGAGLERVRHVRIRIVASDPRVDLALLKIEDAQGGTPFPTVPVGESQLIEEGQSVFAIGSPLGLDRTVSQGIVSSRNRLVDGQLYIQTTTQINPGNSGGPLFNLRGEVVGVNNMKAMAVGVEGLNFAIPASAMKNFLRNRDAYAFDPRNPNAGFRYNSPPRPVENPATLPAENSNP
jgi:serine protease Do